MASAHSFLFSSYASISHPFWSHAARGFHVAPSLLLHVRDKLPVAPSDAEAEDAAAAAAAAALVAVLVVVVVVVVVVQVVGGCE